MEFGERKRRRKSQSYKLVTDEDFDPLYVMNASCKDTNGESKDAAVSQVVWLGDEGLEIKRQITGMMRLLNDKTSRVYQRVGSEQDSLTKQPYDGHQTWLHQPAPLSLVSEERQSNSWNSAGDPRPSLSSISTSIPNGLGCAQYSTRSKALRTVSSTKDLIKVNEANASLERQEQAVLPCQPRLGSGPTPRRRPRKRRPIYKVAPIIVSTARRTTINSPEASPPVDAPAESGKREELEKKQDSCSPINHSISSEVSVLPPQTTPVSVNNTQSPLLNELRETQLLESEVRLAEDYDVFISKPQLDSILVNYTRSGSLLFRKLVCAFFDDATLANSLPNGKRKRGLNDNRKGLDQNIVGAIKEKYCTEHRIEKLPGPRDWVQILQDQIKLARRRLKRDAAEAEEVLNGTSSGKYNQPTSVEGKALNMTG
ncbi:BEN domain-containing protein 7 [Channa argus]|uniref:BEN domain-containing protein 7 n=1 Tax=Channa argus TaxID=215402 RepID=A0A6G1PFZ7_CHAAH|nr:BEN domain-containing protein 7 [Channa argus]